MAEAEAPEPELTPFEAAQRSLARTRGQLQAGSRAAQERIDLRRWENRRLLQAKREEAARDAAMAQRATERAEAARQRAEEHRAAEAARVARLQGWTLGVR